MLCFSQASGVAAAVFRASGAQRVSVFSFSSASSSISSGAAGAVSYNAALYAAASSSTRLSRTKTLRRYS